MDTRPTGLVGTLLYVLIPVSILTILSLLAAPYSIAPLVKVNGLWSLWTWLLFYYFFRRENHLGRFLEQPLLLHGHVAQLNWLCFWTRVSLRLPCTSYIYMPQLFLPSHFIVDPEREFVTSRTLLPSSFHTLYPFVETVTSPRDCLLGKSSLLFFYLFFIL